MTTLNTPNPPTTTDLPAMQREVEGRLASLRTKVRTQIVLDGVARALAAMIAMLLVGLLLDWWLEFGIAGRVGYWLVTFGLAGWLLFRYTIKPLAAPMGPVELAEAVDISRKVQGDALIAPRVSTVLHLPRAMGDEHAVSGSMVYDAVSRSYAQLASNPFDRQTSSRHLSYCLSAVAVAVLLPTLFAIFMDGTASVWASRWLALSNTPWPRNTQLSVEGLTDGKLVIPAGENSTLRFNVSTMDGSEIDDVRLTFRPEGGDRKTVAADLFAAGDYRYSLPPHTTNIEATLRSGDQGLDFQIIPVARPRVTDLKLVHTHPSDGIEKTSNFDGTDSGLALLNLNKVELHLTSNVPITEIRYAEGSDQPAELELIDPTHAVARWEHTDDVRFRLEMVGEEVGLVSQPVPIAVRVKRDRPPQVRLRSEGVGQRITANALVPLNIEARDDSGLKRVAIQLRRERTTAEGRETFDYDPIILYGPVEEVTLDKILRDHGLEVEDLELQPTDLLRITATATDDRYIGEQTGESTQLSFSIVTHDELIREIRARQELARAQFRQAMENATDMQIALTQAKSGDEAKKQARAFRQAQRTVWTVNRTLSATAEEMRLNRLGGSREDGNQAYESIKKQILNPMSHLHDTTMTRQRDRLESADRLPAGQLPQLADQQQQVVDEMYKLLRAMDRWDQLMDVINQLNSIINAQQKIKPNLDNLQEEQFDDFFDE